MLAVRFLLALPFAAGITLGLFYFMQALINTGEQLEQSISVVKIVDATMPEIVLEVVEEIDKPVPIEDMDEVLPEMANKDISLADGPSLNIEHASVDIDAAMQIDNASISATDGDYLPLVTIAPQYPTRALQRGIEGWSLMQFTVSATGSVIEESIEVIDSDPPNVFDRSSIRAVARFKYQPRVVEGKGVDVPGVRTVVRYELDQE